MHPTTDDVEAFLAAVTPARRQADALTLVALLRELTGREPTLWSGRIVGFGSCHYAYPTGTQGDSPILGFAPRRAATTLYLLDGVDSHADTLGQLGPHATGKGCLYLADVSATDPAVLRGLLAESYRRVTTGQLGSTTVTITG